MGMPICIVSSAAWNGQGKMSTLPIIGKISVDAYACVVYVCNLTSALYFAINNHFCVIRVSFVATSQLACRWMCDSLRTGCAWRLTPTCIWGKHAKIKGHIYAIYVSFWELIIAFPNGGQWAHFRKVCPSSLKHLVTPLNPRQCEVLVTKTKLIHKFINFQ